MKTRILLLSGCLLAGCTTPGKRTAIGTGAGAAGGAATGAALGAIAGDAGKGAWIGAAAGSVIGTVIGNHMDKQAKDLAQIAETQRTENGIVTKLKSELLFPTDSADLRPEAKTDLAQIAGILKNYPEDRVTVVGYTDNQGTASYNQALSERRARSVQLALIASGMSSNVIESIGQGESNPIASNATSEGRAQNRRVELLISADPSKVKS